jgi:hypothetical protein
MRVKAMTFSSSLYNSLMLTALPDVQSVVSSIAFRSVFKGDYKGTASMYVNAEFPHSLEFTFHLGTQNVRTSRDRCRDRFTLPQPKDLRGKLGQNEMRGRPCSSFVGTRNFNTASTLCFTLLVIGQSLADGQWDKRLRLN